MPNQGGLQYGKVVVDVAERSLSTDSLVRQITTCRVVFGVQPKTTYGPPRACPPLVGPQRLGVIAAGRKICPLGVGFLPNETAPSHLMPRANADDLEVPQARPIRCT